MGNEPTQVKCEYCDKLFDKEVMRECDINHGHTIIPICDDCYIDHILLCAGCGDEDYKDNMVRSEITGDRYCTDCYSDLFTSCDCCGYEIWRDNGHRYGNLCEECNQQESCDNDECVRYSRSWNYHGTDSDLYYGIELEVGSIDYMGLKSMFVNNLDEDFFDIHSDCSITENGINDEAEIVSHPATYKYLKTHPELWNNVLAYRHEGVISYKAETCGIHVHLSRDYFTPAHLERFLRMVYLQPSFTYFISQRRSSALRQWARLYDDNKLYSKSKLKAKVNVCYSGDRYEAVNLSNHDTIELRIFRGTLNKIAFWKNIEYVQALVEFTKDAKNKLTLTKFLNYVADNKDDYCNLQRWIVKRRAKLAANKEPYTYKKVKRILKHLELV